MAADIREVIERRIAKKRQEVADFETRAREANVYLQALEDTLNLINSGEPEEVGNEDPVFRHGSDVAKARDLLRRTAKPLHISEILAGIGKRNDKKSRVSLGSTISGYVRKGVVFTRPGPNIFGLVEFGAQALQPDLQEPPDDFGDDAYRPTPAVAEISDDDVPF